VNIIFYDIVVEFLSLALTAEARRAEIYHRGRF